MSIRIGRLTISRRAIAFWAVGSSLFYAVLLFVTWQFFLLSFFVFDGGMTTIGCTFVALAMLIPLSLSVSIVGIWVAFGLGAYRASILFCLVPIFVALFSIVSISAIAIAGY